MRKPKKRSAAIAFVLILCIGVSFSVALAKTGDSIDSAWRANALSNAARPLEGLDTSDAFDPEALGHLGLDEDDMCYDTTNADPNSDPLSSFDAEILDALRDAGPETRIDYDGATGTVTIPNQDDSSSEIITETPPYAPDDFAVAPTAPVDIPGLDQNPS